MSSDTARLAQQKGVGREASSPIGIPPRGWRDILRRWVRRLIDDRVDLIAAGVSFYLLLALFPALAAFVSLFGVYLQGAPITEVFEFLETVLPDAAVSMIAGQLNALIGQSRDVLSLGFITGFLVAVWIANRGIMTLFEAMNVAFGEREKRSYLRLYLTSFACTLGAMLVTALFIVGVGVIPIILATVGLNQWTERIVGLLRWPLLFVAAMTGTVLLYRFGPSRARVRLRWIFGSAALATMIWLAASIGFSWYLQNFANYNATYGSLGAVAIFMTWAWFSVYILIAGGELSAEMEHQTAMDSTVGEPKPLGERGATMADTLGESAASFAGRGKKDSSFGKGSAGAELEKDSAKR